MVELYVYLDLETLPPEMNDEELKKFNDNLSPPKTLKDPVKIENWYTENVEKKYRDLAKSSSTANVATLGYAFNENNAVCLYDEKRDEKSLLEAFYEDIINEINNQHVDGDINSLNYTIKFVGFNCRKFDLDLLWKRAKFHGLHDLAKLIPRDKWDKNVIDIMEVFLGSNYHEYISQNAVCEYFKIEQKPNGIDGSKVYDYWMAGRYEEISQYNIYDVETVRKLFKILCAN